jgi:hypothetical protein
MSTNPEQPDGGLSPEEVAAAERLLNERESYADLGGGLNTIAREGHIPPVDTAPVNVRRVEVTDVTGEKPQGEKTSNLGGMKPHDWELADKTIEASKPGLESIRATLDKTRPKKS